MVDSTAPTIGSVRLINNGPMGPLVMAARAGTAGAGAVMKVLGIRGPGLGTAPQRAASATDAGFIKQTHATLRCRGRFNPAICA